MAEHETSPDSDILLKKRARRRLVGASALALLAVIVLPMVMDHEPRPPLLDIQVRIPSQDENALAAKMPSKQVATPLPPRDLQPAVSEQKPEAAPEAKPVAAAEAKPEAKPTPGPQSEPKPEPKPQPKTEPPQDAKSAAAPTSASAKASAPAARAEQWVVQLGAYKEQANVKQLLSKLKGMGVPAYTEAFDSPQGPRTRVRAGPFPSREAAEKARAVKIKAIGMDGPVAPK